MNTTKIRQQLARQLLEPYIHHSSCVAAAITGSVGKNQADEYSDIDAIVYYSQLPEKQFLESEISKLELETFHWRLGDAEEGFMEAFNVGGVEVQLVHTSESRIIQEIEDFTIHHNYDNLQQKVFVGLLAVTPIVGAEWFEKITMQLKNYSPELRQKVISKHLDVFPIWYYKDALKTRDAKLWYWRTLIEATEKLLVVVAAINGAYFSTFQLKHLGDFTESWRIKPRDLYDRIDALLQASMDEGCVLLESLVADTAVLIQAEFPELDINPLIRRLGKRQLPNDSFTPLA